MSNEKSTPEIRETPAERTIKITFFQTVKSNTGLAKDTTWPKLVSFLQRGKTAPKRKDELPLWCPTTFEGNERKGEKAQAISIFAIDIDNEVKPVQLDKLVDPPPTTRIEKNGKITYKIEPPNTVEQVLAVLPETACAWHTSFSHRSEWPKFRFAWPLSRDLTPNDYAKLWTILERRFMAAGVFLDPATKNASRVWYVPARTEHFESGHITGGVIDVDAVLDERLPDEGKVDAEKLEARIAKLPTDVALSKLEQLVDPILDAVARCTPLVQESLVQKLAEHPKLRLGVLRKLLAKKGEDVEVDSSGVLQQILDGLQYIRSPTGRVFARSGSEALPVDGAKFVEKVARAFREACGRFVSKDAISTAMLAIRGQDLDVSEVPIRFARHEGNIYLDLGDDTGRCIEITRDDVRIKPESPIGFYRPATMRPLPTPTIPRCHEAATSDLEPFRELLGVDGESWHACLAWLLSAMGVTGTYTILLVKGQKGSGKSTRARLLRRTIDPRRPELTGLPTTEENLAIQAQNAHVLGYDNLRHLPGNMSDAICRLATLDGLEKRTLYSDQDLTVLEAARPIILNGIADVATEPDLLDRALIVHFQRVEQPKTEDDVAAEHAAMHPAVLGSLCVLCSFALGSDARTRRSRARSSVARDHSGGTPEPAGDTPVARKRTSETARRPRAQGPAVSWTSAANRAIQLSLTARPRGA